jgi:hypothetical protein
MSLYIGIVLACVSLVTLLGISQQAVQLVEPIRVESGLDQA